MAPKDIVRIAALGDLHYGRTTPPGSLQPLFAQINDSADILALCGDLTDYGLVDEARAFVKELIPTVKIPIVAVLGNHDVESGQQGEIVKILADSGIATLDGETIEIEGIGFAGIKGFCGGFGRRALARLRNERTVALLHYAPIQATVEGEPLEIYPFLGCSRLEDPITRYPVSAVCHGHAHHGAPEGRTRNNVPVYNVSASLMREVFPDRPFRLIELAASQPAADRRGADRRTPIEVH